MTTIYMALEDGLLSKALPESAVDRLYALRRGLLKLRRADLFKLPGVAETIDWANALVALDRVALDAATVNATLGVLLKYQDDVVKVAGKQVETLLAETG